MSPSTKHLIAAALATSALFASDASACPSYRYATAGTGPEAGKIEFYENGALKSLTGHAVCTKEAAEFGEWLTKMAAIGVTVMSANPSPNASFAPDQVRYVDQNGNTLNILGVDMVLTRDASQDAYAASLAGAPDSTPFYAYVSPVFTASQQWEDLPSSMNFSVVFEYSSPSLSFSLSELDADPTIVLTSIHSPGSAASTVPAVFDLPADQVAVALESSRVGSPANPDILLPGQSSAPIIGATWDPIIQAYAGTGALDTILISTDAANTPMGGMGTLLCGGTTLLSQNVAHGAGFSIAFPNDPNLVGLALCSQSAVLDGSGISLTNALDIVVGAL